MSERRARRRLMNEINVVPYIDVMLVLLVIFMITAPLINPGEIELPQIGKSLTPPVAPLEVIIDADGTLALRDRSVSGREEKVSRTFWSCLQKDTVTSVYLFQMSLMVGFQLSKRP